MNITLNLSCGNSFDVQLHADRLPDGSIHLHCTDLEDGSFFCDLSRNLTDRPIPEGHAVIKNYSENTGFLEQLIRQGIIEDTGVKVICGYVSLPVCRVLINAEESA